MGMRTEFHILAEYPELIRVLGHKKKTKHEPKHYLQSTPDSEAEQSGDWQPINCE